MSISIYVEETNGREIAVSTSGKWIYDSEKPEWIGLRYKNAQFAGQPVSIEEFAKFFNRYSTGWVTCHEQIPKVWQSYQYFDEDDNLCEDSYPRIISTEEFIDFLRKSTIKELVVYTD